MQCSRVVDEVFPDWESRVAECDDLTRGMLNDMRDALSLLTSVNQLRVAVLGAHWQKDSRPLRTVFYNSGFSDMEQVGDCKCNVEVMAAQGVVFLPKSGGGDRNCYIRESYQRLLDMPDHRVVVIVFGNTKTYRHIRVMCGNKHLFQHYNVKWNTDPHPTSLQFCDAFSYANYILCDSPIDWGAMFRKGGPFEAIRPVPMYYDPMRVFYERYRVMFDPTNGWLAFIYLRENYAWSYAIFSYAGTIIAGAVDQHTTYTSVANLVIKYIHANGLFPCTIVTTDRTITAAIVGRAYKCDDAVRAADLEITKQSVAVARQHGQIGCITVHANISELSCVSTGRSFVKDWMLSAGFTVARLMEKRIWERGICT